MILIIDHDDSFTYNIVQMIGATGREVAVISAHASIEEMDKLAPDSIILSSGAGIPDKEGTTVNIIRHFLGKVPILGIGFGHLAVAVAFGGEIGGSQYVLHGKTLEIHHDGKSVFAGLDHPFQATCYHSLLIQKTDFPACLEVSAQSENEEIMAVRHKEWPVESVQFHPESIMTREGKRLLSNFLKSIELAVK
ncbi:para-aminobenzoate synthetase component 2 [Bacillus thermophilus]|uniref:Para-aminobenzoate synthetase component 2 n=1 Tax=Siminovitchia thermophila TaxID=1245522 RepID=A0ABS2R107_9BACI|nr:aminodeoxychorismate/anthranilate synthase component II [Siminovitchia thermophila]MBM7713055.1 para-aminobenzoate synthetase component 2 [Siminovitchia thermophila]ONK25105.1 anthranilate/aminodeoxychorismate synthase component II [Bacillus sp. VT-16-64]